MNVRTTIGGKKQAKRGNTGPRRRHNSRSVCTGLVQRHHGNEATRLGVKIYGLSEDRLSTSPTFDVFPKMASTYRTRTGERGSSPSLLSSFVFLNDVGEFVWGWPDYEFGVDSTRMGHVSFACGHSSAYLTVS